MCAPCMVGAKHWVGGVGKASKVREESEEGDSISSAQVTWI